jgi:hypothetical protein
MRVVTGTPPMRRRNKRRVDLVQNYLRVPLKMTRGNFGLSNGEGVISRAHNPSFDFGE